MQVWTPPAGRRSPRHNTKEDDWVAGIRAGDVAVFEEVYLAYYQRLWEFANRYVREGDAAEDVVQDVFGGLWLRREMLSPDDSLTAYLFGAVRNRAVQTIRHATVVRRTAPDVLDDARALQDTRDSRPDAAVLESEMAAVVQRALDSLPELGRQVLMLRWQQQLGYSDIARILGISEAAAKQHGSRAQRALRPFFERVFRRDTTADPARS